MEALKRQCHDMAQLFEKAGAMIAELSKAIGKAKAPF